MLFSQLGRCYAEVALLPHARLGLREADGELLGIFEPLLRCPKTEASRAAEVLPLRSSGITD